MSLDPQLAALLAAATDAPAFNSMEPAVARAMYEEMATGMEAAGGPLPSVGSAEGEQAWVRHRWWI